MATPSTNIFVCRVDFTNDYQHVVYFNTADEQLDYFTAKTVKTFVDYTQIRKNWTLKVASGIVQAEKWNYLFFHQNNKRYFYFITNVKYISDETVELTLEMDVMQTYAFDYVLKECFVEREHASTDEVGDNTIDEGLELGTYVDSGKSQPDVFSSMTLMMMVADNFQHVTPIRTMRDGVFSGLDIFAFDTQVENFLPNLELFFTALDDEGKTESITNLWMYPAALIEVDNIYYDDHEQLYNRVAEAKSAGVDYTIPWASFNNLNGYSPKNKKLFTYPYSFIYATDNKGSSAQYRYEYFDNGNPTFAIEGSVYPDGGVKCTPKNYKGAGFNYDEALTYTGFPTCPWVSDSYKLWLAQNQSQHKLGYFMSGASAVTGLGVLAGGVATGMNPALLTAGAGMIAGGVGSIFSQLAQKGDAQQQPNQSHGMASSTLNAALGLYVTFHRRSITKERARIIDEYFTMYGYKTLRVKVPNRNVRKSFTYTKTRNCFINGALCNDDIRKIQSIYDNGVTFWNKDVVIGNYSAYNSTL